MIWLKMKIKFIQTVKHDVKCVKLMVLPGEVQGLGTLIKNTAEIARQQQQYNLQAVHNL